MTAPQRSTNWFAIWISVAVVVVLIALAGVIVFLNHRSSSDGATPDGDIVDVETGAIAIGDGPTEVAVWFDFSCPHCQDFEDVYGPEIQDMVDAGDISLYLQPVALAGLNAASGTEFSERSGGALYCVAGTGADAALSFFQQLFALKPTGPGLTDEELSSLAADAGAPDAAACIAEGTYRGFVVDQAAEIPENPERGGAGTPTLTVDGEYVTITGDVDADIRSRLR